MSVQRFVFPLKFLTLILAPKLLSVVLNQTEPVGLGFVSVDLNSISVVGHYF